MGELSKKRVLLSWSSGKDSAWALYKLQQDPQIEVVALLTTFNSHFQRSAIHGVRQQLVRAQAAAARLPLVEVGLPWPCSNEQYEQIMGEALQRISVDYAPQAIAFGDLFLEDIRAYREQRMASTGLQLLFPLWGMATDTLSREMVDGGLRAHVATLDPKKLPRHLAGHPYDHPFLQALPDGVDPCGENGEFHTFAWDGPMFDHPVAIDLGEVVERDGFVYADLIPAAGN